LHLKTTEEKAYAYESRYLEIHISLCIISQAADMPIGGTNKAKVVPCAICCDTPKNKTSEGTIIVPPPMSMSPLKSSQQSQEDL